MRSLVQRAVAKMLGARRYAYLQEYDALQWRTLAELQEYQFRKLCALLRHAHDTVPYYRRVFGELGIRPEDIRSRSDYAALPVLTKDIIKANRDEMISSRFDTATLHRNSTGGSTGEPLQFFQEMDVYERMCANMMLSLKMSGWREGWRVISIWGNPKDFARGRSLSRRVKEAFSTTLTLNAYKYNEDIFKIWLNTITRAGDVFVYGYPSVISDFAHFVVSSKINIMNVKGVHTSAEKLLPDFKDVIKEAFNCEVFDQYGSRECPGIASECEHGNMHILMHSSYVEFVDDEDVPDGSEKILVTPLNSYAMPFLRYDIGDYAHPLEGKCECGRGFPLMQMNIGRLYDRFVCEGGLVMHGTLLVRQVAGIRGIKNFQFHQRDLGNIDLNIIPSAAFDESDRAKLASIDANLAALPGPRVRIRVNYVESFPQTTGGKHRIFLSDVRS